MRKWFLAFCVGCSPLGFTRYVGCLLVCAHISTFRIPLPIGSQGGHALAGILTCAKIYSIELDRQYCSVVMVEHSFICTFSTADEGGATRMSGGIPWSTC